METFLELDFAAGLARFRSDKIKNIKRPQELTFYSLDEERKVLPGSTASLKYSYPCMSSAPFEFGEETASQTEPINQISLRHGFDTFSKYNDSADEHLDAILDALVAYEEHHGTHIKPDFVMFRGMMTKIMTTPFEQGNDASFEMNATLFQVGS